MIQTRFKIEDSLQHTTGQYIFNMVAGLQVDVQLTKMSSNKTPPLLTKSKSYEDYKKKLSIWSKITSIPKKDQGGAILLTLEKEAEDKVLELDENDIICDQGVENIIKQLDKIYKKK